MRTLLISTFAILFCLSAHGKTVQQMYVAATSGLQIRSSISTSAAVLKTIDYGRKIEVLETDSAVTVAGFRTHGDRVAIDGVTGFVVDAYLLPIPPPRKATETLIDYLNQLSEPFCPPLNKSSGQEGMDNIHRIWKTLFQNGMSYHKHEFYESRAETFLIPDITLEQAFFDLPTNW